MPYLLELVVHTKTRTKLLHVNEQLSEGYNMQLNLHELVEQRERQMEKGMIETGMSAP
jgi:hypothetical protein